MIYVFPTKTYSLKTCESDDLFLSKQVLKIFQAYNVLFTELRLARLKVFLTCVKFYVINSSGVESLITILFHISQAHSKQRINTQQCSFRKVDLSYLQIWVNIYKSCYRTQSDPIHKVVYLFLVQNRTGVLTQFIKCYALFWNCSPTLGQFGWWMIPLTEWFHI